MGALDNINKRYESERGYFDCPVVQMSKLVGKSFYILDYSTSAKTKYGPGRYAVKVTGRPDDTPDKHRKFLTNAGKIKYTLDALREQNKLPYRVTMRFENNQYSFEECGEQ